MEYVVEEEAVSQHDVLMMIFFTPKLSILHF
jgi:hypothetical protein